MTNMKFDNKALLEEIMDQYLADDNNRPWIVAFSGGKDSTALLLFVWYTLEKIKKTNPNGLTRKVYVICNNTLVENPQVLKFVQAELELIQKIADEKGLPIKVDQTIPKLEDTFWMNLIGKGYPAPNSMFRWCTERLKIKPTTRYIEEKISSHGEAIILMGTRSDESATRARSIKKHEVTGSRLRNHPLPNAKSYAPIKDMTTDEVWEFLSTNKNPWNNTYNDKLITLYVNGSGGDCPIVMDINTPSCGNSRFGCWVCSVVKRDKSMEALIDSGEDWMIPLVKIRDFLVKTINRDDKDYDADKYRMPIRRNGAVGIGAYWPEVRKEILVSVLKAQVIAQKEDPELRLISFQELVGIQLQWNRDFIFDFTVSEIYQSIYGEKIAFDGTKSDNYSREKEIINDVCKSHPEDIKLIHNLLNAQKNKVLMVKKIGLQNDIESLIDEQVNLTYTKHYNENKKNNIK